MTAKAKAIDLVNKFQWKWDIARMSLVNSKQCALICVDEVLENITEEVMTYKPFMMNTDYWQEVKEEINKL